MAMPTKSELFSPELVTDLFNKVTGKSTLSKLSTQTPIPFNGAKQFTFSMDNEIDVVAEGGKKTLGGITMTPITIVPIKVEYGARYSDEFMYATEEAKIGVLKAFNDGFAKKLARGLDLMAFHGVNPRTGQASTVIGQNSFDTAVTQTVVYDDANPKPDIDMETAIRMVTANNGEVTGAALSPAFGSALAALMANGVRVYPELAWGGAPEQINGLQVSVNRTVSDLNSKDRAIVGDFSKAFKWGYAKDVTFEVIQYGNPDNSGNDLKGYNEVYLRAEAYLGWAVLDPKAFTRIAIA